MTTNVELLPSAPTCHKPMLVASGFEDEDEQWDDEPDPCSVCGDINGMINPCCADYDPLHRDNCGYG